MKHNRFKTIFRLFYIRT